MLALISTTRVQHKAKRHMNIGEGKVVPVKTFNSFIPFIKPLLPKKLTISALSLIFYVI